MLTGRTRGLLLWFTVSPKTGADQWPKVSTTVGFENCCHFPMQQYIIPGGGSREFVHYFDNLDA